MITVSPLSTGSLGLLVLCNVSFVRHCHFFFFFFFLGWGGRWFNQFCSHFLQDFGCYLMQNGAGNIIKAAEGALKLEQDRFKKLTELDERNKAFVLNLNKVYGCLALFFCSSLELRLVLY